MTLHRAATALACGAIAVACAALIALDPATIVRPRWDGQWTR